MRILIVAFKYLPNLRCWSLIYIVSNFPTVPPRWVNSELRALFAQENSVDYWQLCNLFKLVQLLKQAQPKSTLAHRSYRPSKKRKPRKYPIISKTKQQHLWDDKRSSCPVDAQPRAVTTELSTPIGLFCTFLINK